MHFAGYLEDKTLRSTLLCVDPLSLRNALVPAHLDSKTYDRCCYGDDRFPWIPWLEKSFVDLHYVEGVNAKRDLEKEFRSIVRPHCEQPRVWKQLPITEEITSKNNQTHSMASCR